MNGACWWLLPTYSLTGPAQGPEMQYMSSWHHDTPDLDPALTVQQWLAVDQTLSAAFAPGPLRP